MIVDRDTKPDKNLYFIGSQVLTCIRTSQFGIIPLEDLYVKLLEERKRDISFEYFLLALDWLFLIGVIESNEDGDILKCF